MFTDLEGRIDRIVNDLLRGRRLRLGPGEATEREAIMTAAELAAGQEGYPRMSPAFRRRLAAALVRGEDPGQLTRRTALGAVAGIAAGVVGAAALGRLPGAAGAPAGAASVAGGLMRPGGGRWLPVANLSQLSEQQPTRVVAGDLVAFLFRQGGEVTGVSGICSHWPCVLNWKPSGGTLLCPCHPVEFTPDGKAKDPGYAVPPLSTIQVRVEGEQVLVYSP
jgi:nitrite reductase/ring-hydroxylating ferredoxin subunit